MCGNRTFALDPLLVLTAFFSLGRLRGLTFVNPRRALHDYGRLNAIEAIDHPSEMIKNSYRGSNGHKSEDGDR